MRDLDLLLVGENKALQFVNTVKLTVETSIQMKGLVNCFTVIPDQDKRVIAGMSDGFIQVVNCET